MEYMSTLLATIEEFVKTHSTIFGTVSGLSLALLILTLLIMPIVLIRLPADYLTHAERKVIYRQIHHPLIGFLIFTGKNILGVCLIALGILMLLTPGQGLLTILAGIAAGNLPGKYRLERWLLTRKAVWRSVQYLRQKGGVEPMQWPL